MKRKINITISDVASKSWTFENLKSFTSFLKNEIKFWEKQSALVSQQHAYFSQGGQLQHTLNTINDWKDKIDTWDDATLQQQIAHLQSSYINNFRSYWLWSGHPFVSAWIESCKISNETGQAFIDVILKGQVNNQQNLNYFKGNLLAYEFIMQDESTITQRRNSEKQSTNQLRDRLDTSTNELIAEADEFKEDYKVWFENTQTQINEEQAKKLTEFNTFIADSNAKIEELEKTYHEKLRLEKPAKYWNTKALSYKTQGIIWSCILGGFLLCGIVGFGYLFDKWLEAKSIGIELNSVQGILMFATIITVYAFLIKSISKMVFSSFHLQRDAEEREQLTHVYLALANENGAIDEESRKIVLQALFSRVDSGLLHKDSSPTMPGIVELVKATGANK